MRPGRLLSVILVGAVAWAMAAGCARSPDAELAAVIESLQARIDAGQAASDRDAGDLRPALPLATEHQTPSWILPGDIAFASAPAFEGNRRLAPLAGHVDAPILRHPSSRRSDKSESADAAAGGAEWPMLPGMLALAADDQTDANGQEAPPAPIDRWRFKVAPYVWLPEMSGSATVLGVKQAVDLSLCDLFALADELDMIVPVKVEARHGRWNLWLDLMYMKMHDRMRESISKQVGPLTVTANAKVDVEVRMLLMEFGADYELFTLPLSADRTRQLRFDVRGGGRYVRMEGEADVTIDGSVQIGPRRRRGLWHRLGINLASSHRRRVEALRLGCDIRRIPCPGHRFRGRQRLAPVRI